MKKTYISPETLVVDIRFNHTLLAGSPQITDDTATTDGNGDYNPSRFFSFDEDAEDEEY